MISAIPGAHPPKGISGFANAENNDDDPPAEGDLSIKSACGTLLLKLTPPWRGFRHYVDHVFVRPRDHGSNGPQILFHQSYRDHINKNGGAMYRSIDRLAAEQDAPNR